MIRYGLYSNRYMSRLKNWLQKIHLKPINCTQKKHNITVRGLIYVVNISTLRNSDFGEFQAWLYIL